MGALKLSYCIERLTAEGQKLAQDVDNAFRALVLMSTELERVVGLEASPLPHFNEDLASTLVIPSVLKPVIDDCRRKILRESR